MNSYFIGVIKNFEIIFNKIASSFIHENCLYFNLNNCKNKLIIDSDINLQSKNKIEFKYKDIFEFCLLFENMNLIFKLDNINYFINNLKNNTTILISNKNEKDFQLTLINGNQTNEKNKYIYINFKESDLILNLIIISILTFIYSFIIFKYII